MDITGTWDASVTTPMGPIDLTFNLVQEGSDLGGTCIARGDTLPLRDGSVDGDTAKFALDIESPMKLTLSATVKVQGDTMTGKAKPGALPAAKLTATRQH